MDDALLAATSDGIWLLTDDVSGSASWIQLGLDGQHVTRLLEVSETDQLIASTRVSNPSLQAPVYLSTDGGQSWTAAGSGLYDPEYNRFAEIADMVVQPGSGGQVLYGNIDGQAIVVSSDGGISWRVVRGTLDSFGYHCYLHILTLDPNILYQGCEAPLDHAWVRTYDISDPLIDELGDGDLIVGGEFELSNRRINSFYSFENDQHGVYAGLEGASIRITGSGWQWMFESDGKDIPYVYVKFIWVHSANRQHLVFGGSGGSLVSDGRSGLLETADSGQSMHEVDPPSGIDFRVNGVMAGAAIEDGTSYAIAVLTENGAAFLARSWDE